MRGAIHLKREVHTEFLGNLQSFPVVGSYEEGIPEELVLVMMVLGIEETGGGNVIILGANVVDGIYNSSAPTRNPVSNSGYESDHRQVTIKLITKAMSIMCGDLSLNMVNCVYVVRFL